MTPGSEKNSFFLRTAIYRRIFTIYGDFDISLLPPFFGSETESNSKRDKSTFDASLPSPSSEESTPLSDVNVKVTLSDTEELQRPKGLQNLGNTCFFNSVMQNLAQTHLLTDACIAAARNSPGGVLWTVQPMGKKSVIRVCHYIERSMQWYQDQYCSCIPNWHVYRRADV